ncbi:type II CRISPR RNA-guided endonuclease Cas9 [bacterium]|nr:type II CRISPR RNA-guided endonuclease Cas9 [bacterium]
MKEKILGLDIGITSVGFAVVEYDDEKFEGQIKDKGVRIFEACEVAKTKESLNAKRREYRGMRRRLSRRSNRLKAIKQLFIKNNYLPEETINNLFCNSANKIDVWNLRKEALQRKLTNEEFYRIVHQIAKRRGFKSIRKSEEAKNEGQLLTNIKQNCELFENSDYQTIGEMFATIYTGDNAKRNKRDEYKNSVPRELLQDELKIIFKKQREFHLECANLDFEEDIMDIAFYQRPLKSMKEMVGYCTFEKNEKRAPKAAYTSEIFTAAQKLVNLKYINPLGEEFSLNAEQSKVLINAAHKIKKVTYKRAKKELGFDENIRFKGINYSNKDKDPETTALIELKKYHEFKDAIGENDFYNIQDVETIFNNIAEVLTYEKSDEAIVAEMKNKNIPDNIIEKVKDCSASKVMHLSIKAMKNIIPYMLDGNKYHEACQLAGYDFKNEIISKGLNYLPVLPYEELTTNPVVNRAISQTRKVVNALIKKHEKYDKIKIETARDLGKSIDERNKIKRGQDDFQKKKEEAKKRCIEKWRKS